MKRNWRTEREPQRVLRCAMTCCGLLMAPPASAQEVTASVRPYGWWFEVRLGAALLDSESSSLGGDPTAGWVLDFAGGLRLGEHWLVGLDLGGIGIQSYDLYDVTAGESLDHIFLVTQYHSRWKDGWFLHAAAGSATYTDFSENWFEFEGDGWGAELGLGYDWLVSDRGRLSVLARYEIGHIALDHPEFGNDYDYSAPKLSVSWAFR